MNQRERYAQCGRAIFLASLPVLFLTAISPCAARAQGTAVLTGEYNVNRTGANLAETTLTPSNVSPATFGLLFSQPVDADIFAQPLYVPGLTINGALHNVVFVATLNNSVYAFDADTSQLALWHASLGTPVPIGTTTQPTVGILSTPVIDLRLKVIFVVTFTYEKQNACVPLARAQSSDRSRDHEYCGAAARWRERATILRPRTAFHGTAGRSRRRAFLSRPTNSSSAPLYWKALSVRRSTWGLATSTERKSPNPTTAG